MTAVSTYLMFQGDAEAALDAYAAIFDAFVVEDIERYGPEEAVASGALKLARISFAGHQLRLFNSPPVHDFSFTPSMSLFLDMTSRDELERALAALSEGGRILMPLDDYGFSAAFSWVEDRFGVSWQLNLPR
ncbi:MAG: VOC family protein [Pseudomonadota bacterium]